MAQEHLKSYLIGISRSIAPVMLGCCHTLASSLSKPRSSLEAGKKQPRVWLEYISDVAKMLLYPSFGALIVLLWFLSCDTIFPNERVQRKQVSIFLSEREVLSTKYRLFLKSHKYEVKIVQSGYEKRPCVACLNKYKWKKLLHIILLFCSTFGTHTLM